MKIKFYILFAVTFLTTTTFADEPVSCSKLSDSFCKQLWSKDNLGNVTLSDGNKISQGSTPSKLISNARYIYLKKIADRKCQLPKDFQEALKVNCNTNSEEDVLFRLSEHLKITQNPNFKQTRTDIKVWHREFDLLTATIDEAIEDVSDKRIQEQFPEISQKNPAKLTDQEKGVLSDFKYKFSKEFLDSLYLHSTEWKRVQALFTSVQSEISKLVDSMNLDDETTAFMKQKVASVELTLPYQDPRLMGSDSGCSSTQINAFYSPFHHKFTVCIGMLNTVTSDGSMFFLMAHEIAHSIDPSNLTRSYFKQKSPIAKLVGRTYQTNASIPCSEWETAKAKSLEPTDFVFALPASVNNVTQCLVDRSHIKPITADSLGTAMQVITTSVMNGNASQKLFTILSQKTILEEGAEVENGVYLNPQALLARSTDNLVIDYYSSGELNVGAVFVQEFKCLQQVKDKGEFVAFAEAMETTSKIIASYYENESRYMGQNSPNLQGFNLSRPAGEDFSDWVAFQIYPSFLRSMDSIEDRRNALVSGQTIFCSPSGIEELAMEKVTSEKKWSKTPHPVSRIRRMRFFTPEVADLVNCQRDQAVETAGSECSVDAIKAL